MISLMLSHVRLSVAGSCASAFQKLLIQSVLRVAMMSSNTARTSGPASAYSISRTVVMLGPSGNRMAHPDIGFHVEAAPSRAVDGHGIERARDDVAPAPGEGEAGPLLPRRQR